MFVFVFGRLPPQTCRPHATTMSSRASLDALEATAARRRAVAAGPQADAPPPAEVEPSSEPSGDAEPIAAPAEPSAEASPPAEAEPSADAELSEASAEPAEPRAASPATAAVEPHVDAEPSAETPPPADAGPRVEAPAPEAEPCAEAKFDWNATPGPAKFAAFMEAFPPEKYGGPAYVPAYPPPKEVNTLSKQPHFPSYIKFFYITHSRHSRRFPRRRRRLLLLLLLAVVLRLREQRLGLRLPLR